MRPEGGRQAIKGRLQPLHVSRVAHAGRRAVLGQVGITQRHSWTSSAAQVAEAHDTDWVVWGERSDPDHQACVHLAGQQLGPGRRRRGDLAAGDEVGANLLPVGQVRRERLLVGSGSLRRDHTHRYLGAALAEGRYHNRGDVVPEGLAEQAPDVCGLEDQGAALRIRRGGSQHRQVPCRETAPGERAASRLIARDLRGPADLLGDPGGRLTSGDVLLALQCAELVGPAPDEPCKTRPTATAAAITTTTAGATTRAARWRRRGELETAPPGRAERGPGPPGRRRPGWPGAAGREDCLSGAGARGGVTAGRAGAGPDVVADRAGAAGLAADGGTDGGGGAVARRWGRAGGGEPAGDLGTAVGFAVAAAGDAATHCGSGVPPSGAGRVPDGDAVALDASAAGGEAGTRRGRTGPVPFAVSLGLERRGSAGASAECVSAGPASTTGAGSVRRGPLGLVAAGDWRRSEGGAPSAAGLPRSRLRVVRSDRAGLDDVGPRSRFADRLDFPARSAGTLAVVAAASPLADADALIRGIGSVAGSCSCLADSDLAASTAACMRDINESGSTGTDADADAARAAPGTRRRSGRLSSSITEPPHGAHKKTSCAPKAKGTTRSTCIQGN